MTGPVGQREHEARDPLIRIHGPHKATALVKEADAAHAEGRAPDWMAVLEDLSAKAEREDKP